MRLLRKIIGGSCLVAMAGCSWMPFFGHEASSTPINGNEPETDIPEDHAQSVEQLDSPPAVASPRLAESQDELPDTHERILIARVPSQLPEQEVLAAVAQAFAGRRWEVADAVPEQAVVGRLEHKGYRCELSVSPFQGMLIYADSCVFQVANAGSGSPPILLHKPIPKHWLNFLRKDVRRALAERAATYPANEQREFDVTPSSAERLRQLLELRRDGLISDEEYEKKRKEVLEDL